MGSKKVIAILLFLIALLTFAGCDPVSESNAKGEKDEGAEAAHLVGTWKRDTQEIQYYVFGADGKFTLISVDADTATYSGKYTILDSMIHVILFVNDEPQEELWLRLDYMEDSILLYKGGLFNGSSSVLVGEWEVESTVKDSSGNLFLYQAIFMDNGLFLRFGPGYVDTSTYSFDDSSVTMFDRTDGKVKMEMGYEIRNGRLSIYNLNAKQKFYRDRKSFQR